MFTTLPETASTYSLLPVVTLRPGLRTGNTETYWSDWREVPGRTEQAVFGVERKVDVMHRA